MRDQSHLLFNNLDHQTFVFRLTDVTGRLMIPEQIISGNEVWIERKNLSSGIYFIGLTDEKNKKFVRTKLVLE